MLMSMGFSSVAKECGAASQPLHERYKDEFPVTKRLTYLNDAAVAPLCWPAAEAMKRLADDALHHGLLHYDQWMAAYHRVSHRRRSPHQRLARRNRY